MIGRFGTLMPGWDCEPAIWDTQCPDRPGIRDSGHSCPDRPGIRESGPSRPDGPAASRRLRNRDAGRPGPESNRPPAAAANQGTSACSIETPLPRSGHPSRDRDTLPAIGTPFPRLEHPSRAWDALPAIRTPSPRYRCQREAASRPFTPPTLIHAPSRANLFRLFAEHGSAEAAVLPIPPTPPPARRTLRRWLTEPPTNTT